MVLLYVEDFWKYLANTEKNSWPILDFIFELKIGLNHIILSLIILPFLLIILLSLLQYIILSVSTICFLFLSMFIGPFLSTLPAALWALLDIYPS